MSTHVVTEFHAMPGRGGDVEKLLLEILGESLEAERASQNELEGPAPAVYHPRIVLSPNLHEGHSRAPER
jgi:hypothetical protein